LCFDKNRVHAYQSIPYTHVTSNDPISVKYFDRT